MEPQSLGQTLPKSMQRICKSSLHSLTIAPSLSVALFPIESSTPMPLLTLHHDDPLGAELPGGTGFTLYAIVVDAISVREHTDWRLVNSRS